MRSRCRTFCVDEYVPDLHWDETSIQTHALSLPKVNGTVTADVRVALTLPVELVVVVLVVVVFWSI